jgi:metal-responsive CopG/Arc/MetJ family transcriptional regulator
MAKYTFRTKIDDKELDEILSSLQGTKRADFIRNALYFYIKYKDALDDINNNLLDIKEMLDDFKKSGMSVKESIKEPEQEPVKNDNEDIFKEMVNDFLNL